MSSYYKLVALAAAFVALLVAGTVDPLVGSLALAQSEEKRYAIVFRQSSSLPSDVDRIVTDARGTVTMRLPQIGVVAATSYDPNFAAAIAADPRVEVIEEDGKVQADGPPEEQLEETVAADGPAEPSGPDPQPGSDNLYSQQWDKMRMNVSLTGSYAVQRGRPEVVVAVLDTGVQADHPDIEPNLDRARSRSFACVPGSLCTELESVFDDFRGHGTFMASTIAAPMNTIGISGVAPNVTVVALKVIDKDNFFSSFAHVASALIYAGENRFDVANMSFSTTLNRTESEPRGRIRLLQRAVNFARANGVTLVTSLGNDNADLREGRAFVRVPAELGGVIGASATGYFNFKPAYSAYGVGTTDVSAPAGDLRRATPNCPAGSGPRCGQQPPAPYRGRGQMLGAWSSLSIATGINAPAAIDREQDCVTTAAGVKCGFYRWSLGTSMSAAHVSGVAALIISQYGDLTAADSGKSHMSPTAVEAILQNTANNQPCPDPKVVVYDPPPAVSTCTGDAGYNSFFGRGIVDAFKAVTTYRDR